MIHYKLKHIIRFAICMLVLMLPASFMSNEVYAESNTQSNTDYIKISDYEGMLTMASNPDGKYVLTQDIDMSGNIWTPVEFRGVLDGAGHALLNVSINQISDNHEVTYDGNMKSYDTYFAGFFESLKGASVMNLSLINERIDITTDKNCFVGGVAGYADNAIISNCTITGRMDLSVSSNMFGIAGAVGFGNGTVEDTDIDVTLVNIDTHTDKSVKNEQFMGGILADGYMDFSNCNVNIAGYDSDHGYVHDGGLVGMYMLYPYGTTHNGYMNKCNVTGTITFFEDNSDRRAYCSAYVGEVENWVYTVSGNTEKFTRDERYDYTVNLQPDMCSEPDYTSIAGVVTEPSCNSYGYTTFTCRNCGYSYTDNYTLHVHTVNNWTITREPTYEDEGIKTGNCTLCGENIEEKVARLTSQPESEVTGITTASDTQTQKIELLDNTTLLVCIVVLVVIISVVGIIRIRRR